MSCNLSVSESLLFFQRALAFSACTCFLDPMSLAHLQGYRGSGTFVAGGAETGLGWFCGCMATCFSMAIHCCWSLKLSIWLLITGCPCLSLVPERQGVERALHLKQFWWHRPWCTGWTCLSLGLRCSKTAVSCSQMMSQLKNYWCHLYWCSLQLSFQRGKLGKDTEDSLVVVSDTGCELAGWESLGEGCGSLRSEYLVVTLVCLIGMSRSGSVTFSLQFLLFLVEVSSRGCLLGSNYTVLVTGLSSKLVIFACLLGWTLLSGTVSEN